MPICPPNLLIFEFLVSGLGRAIRPLCRLLRSCPPVSYTAKTPWEKGSKRSRQGPGGKFYKFLPKCAAQQQAAAAFHPAQKKRQANVPVSLVRDPNKIT